MSILTAWSPFFHSSVRMRGRAYLTADRVRRTEPTEDDELIRAEVRDEAPTEVPHVVTIRRDGKRAEAECTCPQFEDGAYCRHIWATLLDVQHHDGPGAASEELARLRVRAPKARKRDSSTRNGGRPQRQSEPEWIGRLSLLRPVNYEQHNEPANAGASVLPAQQQVCYMILPDESERAQMLVVELRQRTPTATGWSRSKPLKLEPHTIATLADATDRELCALLLGGALAPREGTLNRGEAKFRLPPGAWRTLLRRMIATGRCFLGASEDDPGGEQPLRWSGEAPWTLWMVGRLVGEHTPQAASGEPSESPPPPDGQPESHADGNGQPDVNEAAAQAPDGADDDPSQEANGATELLVTLELRRGDQAIPIERPRMVLGGLDGLMIDGGQAAGFDDRDALRWVSHFRDEHRRGDEPRPIRVPRADVERFLDRLYMLPQLPEIDLPDGIGRVPQHLEPTAHLELFGPGSTETNQLLPSSAKNQLVAKVWFGYDTQRVTPGQPGRFITVSSSASRTDEPALPEATDASTPASGAPDASAPNASAPDAGAPNRTGHLSDQSAPAPDSDSDAAPDTDSAESADNTTNDTAEAPPLPPDGLLIQRNHRAEREAMNGLIAQGLRPLTSAGPDVLALPARQVPEAVGELLRRGWHVAADRRSVRDAAAPRLSVTTGTDWFELRGNVRYQRADGSAQDIPLPEILAAARRGEHMINLDDGSQGLVPEQWLEQHGLLTAMGQLEEDHLRFSAPQAALLDALLAEQASVEVDEPFERLRQRLSQFRGVQPIDPDPRFKGALRPYQREGLGWMAMLRWFGTGGILADDMGLGKTIQVLAMLQMRVHEQRQSQAAAHGGHVNDPSSNTEAPAHRPSLVVAPRSVVFNWVDEAQKFTDDLRVLAYTGADRQTLREAFAEHDLIVTSYGLLRRDIEALREFEFDYLILDEAQAIKNPAAQGAKAARLLRGLHRLALTGTPVENHLGDLWSIFEFLNPGMLGASAKFNELLRSTGSNGNGAGASGNTARPDERTLGQISQALRPFILRRTKKQVLADLPDKTEQTIACEMDSAQRKIYDELRNYYRSHLFSQLDQIKAGGAADAGRTTPTIGGKAGFMVLEALLRLRQAACHPGLISEDYNDAPSAKIDVLMELLEDVSAEGSKALIFSQFTSMLALVRQRFEQHNVRYCYLDGQTRNRREVVHRFQSDPRIDAFLVSLKSGGFGLNLTAAEYVFILDPWWNPAVEQQAIDRTHRIGQTRRVFAYRLICQDTVEQRIIDLQQQKQQIAEAIVGGEQHMLANLTRDDLEQLLS